MSLVKLALQKQAGPVLDAMRLGAHKLGNMLPEGIGNVEVGDLAKGLLKSKEIKKPVKKVGQDFLMRANPRFS